MQPIMRDKCVGDPVIGVNVGDQVMVVNVGVGDSAMLVDVGGVDPVMVADVVKPAIVTDLSVGDSHGDWCGRVCCVEKQNQVRVALEKKNRLMGGSSTTVVRRRDRFAAWKLKLLENSVPNSANCPSSSVSGETWV